MSNQKMVLLLLRVAIASVFLYAAIAATFDHSNWIGFIPQIAERIAPASTLLTGFALFQFILAVWVLSGWKTFYASLLAAFTLLGIISANWGDLNVLFRDFAIFFSAIALTVGSYTKKKQRG